MGNQGAVRTGEKGGLERAFCVDHLGPHTDPQILWEARPPRTPQPAPRVLTASTHS